MKKTAKSKPRLLALNGETKPEPIFLNLNEGESSSSGATRYAICRSRTSPSPVNTAESFAKATCLTSKIWEAATELSSTICRLKPSGSNTAIRFASEFLFYVLVDENDNAPFAGASFDDGTLVTNSTIRLFPNAEGERISD
jgi:hypothetical protein